MEKKYFLLRLIGPRPTFPFDMSEVERKAMAEHAAYWKALQEKGIVIVYGPVFDPKGAWGVGILEVDSEDEIHEFKMNDPVIKADLKFTYEAMPMRMGGIRKG